VSWKYKTVYIEEWISYDDDGDPFGDGWVDQYDDYWDVLTDFFDDQDDYGWELVTMAWTENTYDDDFDGYYAVFRKKADK
jgi:hypothetical protein